MGRDLSHDEIRELLGAHALGATDRDEADAVEYHLLECADCRAELLAHRETSAMLDAAFPVLAPQVWDRISSALTEEPPPLRLEELSDGGTGPAAPGPGTAPAAPVTSLDSRRRRVPLAVAAAVAVLAMVVGGGVVALIRGGTGTVSSPPSIAALARQAAKAPGSRTMTMVSPDKTTTMDVVVASDGTGYVTGGSLPHLPSGEAYQLWGIEGVTPVSLGVMGTDPYTTRFQLTPGSTSLAVSEEPSSGSISPTRVLMSANLD